MKKLGDKSISAGENIGGRVSRVLLSLTSSGRKVIELNLMTED